MSIPVSELLAYKAYQLRNWSLQATTTAGSGHPTSCLSAADIVATIFFHAMHIDPTNPANPDNDQFILSKGHAAPVLYAALAELGIIKHQDLLTLRSFDSVLEGHPTPRCPFINVATGSLGMGLSMGLGMALYAQVHKLRTHAYVLLGDSELAEGCVWEAAELAAYYKTHNLIALVDVNRLGQRGQTIDAHNIETIAQKFIAFGWHAITVDGHNTTQLCQALDDARTNTTQPTVIVAKTIKGYGIQQVEDKNGYHGKTFSAQELPKLLTELHRRFWHASWNAIPPVIYHEIKTQMPTYPIVTLPPAPYQQATMVEPRQACGQALVMLGENMPDVMCLDAEVSNSTRTELFAQKFPTRFIECFIAEQNMVAMATGLAAQGAIPFVASFAAFLTRAFDQLRMAAVSHAAIRVIGSHVGVSIGQDGPSQMGLEDIAMMCTLPQSLVLYPSDAVATHALVGLMAQYHDGISYLRVTRNALPVIYQPETTFVIGGFHIHQVAHAQAIIIAAGITLHEALRAQQILAQNNIAVTVIDLYCIKPLNEAHLNEVVAQCNNTVITVEDHYLYGGLGQAVCYALRNSKAHVTCLAVNNIPHSGVSERLMAWAAIDATAIVNTIQNTLKI